MNSNKINHLIVVWGQTEPTDGAGPLLRDRDGGRINVSSKSFILRIV